MTIPLSQQRAHFPYSVTNVAHILQSHSVDDAKFTAQTKSIMFDKDGSNTSMYKGE